MGNTSTVRFEHGGAVWDIPCDLIELQRRWYELNGAVHTLVEGDDVEPLRSARAQRLELTEKIVDHPWLTQAMDEGRRFQADQALKAAARSAT